MSKYRYQLIWDIEVDAPTVMVAHSFLRKTFEKDHKKRFQYYCGSVRMPSQKLKNQEMPLHAHFRIVQQTIKFLRKD